MSNCQNCQWPHMLKKLQTSNWIISTTFGMKIQKYLSCHHPARLPEKHLGFGGMTGGPQKTYHPKNQTAGGIRVEDEGMNLEKKDPWVPTWICQKHQVYLGTVYHSLIPYVFFDILLGKWYILRWIRQVPKTTRMYFFSIWSAWVCWFGAWKMFQTYAPKWWCLSSWWFQPTWKILVKIEIFPK